MASGTLDFRFLALRALAACAVVGAIACLGACSPAASVQPLLSERCLRLGGPRQEITLPVLVPQGASGLLGVSVRERGISAVAALMADGTTREAASPIDRLGTITLARDATPGHVIPVRIASIDSRDIIADVCVSAELVRPADGPEALAWRRLAAAGEATRSRKWQSAFDRYLAAARLFDGLGAAARAADARQAMAELEYGNLRRERDSVALTSAILADSSDQSPDTRGARVMLMAKALSERPIEGDVPVDAVRRLLQRASELFSLSEAGRRELPRIEILEGFLDYRRNRPLRATRSFGSAAQACESLKDWECFARARQNMAALAEDRQNFAAAMSAYEDALGSLDVTRMPKLAADISYNLGRLEGRLGLFGASETSQRSAMRLYAGLGYCDRVRRAEASLGQMLLQIGSISDARSDLERAATLNCAQLFRAIEEPRESAGDFSVAFPSGPIPGRRRLAGADAFACIRKPPFDDSTLNGEIAVFEALLSLSEIARSDQHLAVAQNCLSVAGKFSVDARTQVRLANARGELQLELGRPRVAQREFFRARRLANAASLADASDFRGVTELGLSETALALREPAAAYRHSRAALELSSSRADPSQITASLRLLAASESASGHRAQAIRTLRAAIALIERTPTSELDPEQRATYLATQYAVFADLTDLLASDASGGDQEAAWRAFSVAEEGHARSLRYAIEQASREHLEPGSSAGTRAYRRLLLSISAAASRDRGGISRLVGVVADSEPRDTSATPFDRVDLAKRLSRSQAVLIEYAAGSDDMFAFVTDGHAMHVVRLGRRSTIAAASLRLVEQLRRIDSSPGEVRAAARAVARRVLWPIIPYLTGKLLIVVPDDALHTVPLSVLPWSSAERDDIVLNHAELATIPSALLLARELPAEPPLATGAKFVLVGDPVLRRPAWYRTCARSPLPTEITSRPAGSDSAFEWSRSLPSLPGTRAEITEISDIARRWSRSADIETLLGCAATPDALRVSAPQAAVLHIATHGLVDARRPRLSALVLTPEAPSAPDSAFRLLQILKLHLQARLVVLSACDTSRGRLLPGEGVLGLAQAFLQAGAQSVVATYWRVEDAAVAPFMARFYRHLLADRLPVAAALRKTQLEQFASTGSYSWAAFSLYGLPDSRL